jgi:myosin V
MAAAYI